MGSLSATLAKIGKKILVDILTDPEKIIKYLFILVIIPVMLFLLIFTLPIIFSTSVPTVLLDADTTPELNLKQINTIHIYQDAPIAANKNINDWIKQKRSEYSWCDDIRVDYDFDVNWKELIAIDSVRLNQDFTNVSKYDVINLAEQFLIKDVNTQEYKERKSYVVKETYFITVVDDEGNEHKEKRTKKVTKYKWVTRTRAIIKVSTKSFNDVIKQLKFEDFEKQVANNIYSTIYDVDVEGNLNIYDDIDLENLKEYPPGNSNIVYFNQADKRWGYSSYGNSTIKSGGCGPTSLAMIIYSLKNRTDVNPKVVSNWSVANGHRAEGIGSYWSLITAGGEYFGLKVEQVSRMNPEKIVKALSDGYPVIASMGRGHFTKGGHFIVLRGITKDGKILVNDPASTTRTTTEWDLYIIMNESSTNGGINGSPFWIFKP